MNSKKSIKRPIIFLDIDGVLNVIPQGRDEFGSRFHQHFMDNLKLIVDATDAVIVISSSWRHDGLKTMQEMWVTRGIAGEVIDTTPTHSSKYLSEPNYCNLPFHERLERGFEIQDWLDKNSDKVKNYLVLDDDCDFLESQMDCFVQTSENYDHTDHVEGYGLTKECTAKAISILTGTTKNIKCSW